MQKVKAVASADGKTLTFIYSDDLVDLLKHGKASITRVSNVEPAEGGGWQAKMADGTVLPVCKLRSEALALEVEYLDKILFGKGVQDESGLSSSTMLMESGRGH